jgi:serine/threonine protein kinase/Flp pilus assembly protein TadD
MPHPAQDDDLVMSLVDLALTQPPDQREAYLRSACGADTDLFDETWTYVQSEQRMNGFLLDPLFPPVPDEHPFEPGQVLEHRFRIVREVAEGGMGVVYEAMDEKLGRRIAIKCAKAGFHKQLPPEVRHATQISHPNVCKIFEIHTTSTPQGEMDFLTMEFLEGEVLGERLRRGRLPQEEARTIGLQLCAGLAEAHRNRVIHGDLKSNNVILTTGADGAARAVITDFGLASRPEVTQRNGQSSKLAGTPDYMAPELWRGHKASVASDVYALGVILYELASGHRPFGAEVGWEQRCTQKPPTVHPRWDRILARCLDPDPARRFRDADEVSQELAPQRPRRWFVAAATPTVITAILLASMAMVPPLRERAAEWMHQKSLPQQKLIAVLPFATGSPANQALSDGLNDLISYKLAQLEQFYGSLLVVDASEVNARGAKTPSTARRFLGANLAIVGAVLRSGDQCQALVSLVDTRNQAQLRSATIEGRLSEMTVFRDRVISRVAQMLDLELTAQAQRTLGRGETSVATAYANYLEGRGYLQRREIQGNLERATAAFRNSVVRDPRYALAYAGLAESLYRQYDVKKDPQFIDEAFTTCSRAIELNDQLEPVHVIMGLIKSTKGNYEGAEAEFRLVLALNPRNPEAHRGLAETYEFRSRPNDAETAYKTAIELRPNDWASHNRLGTFYFGQSCLPQAETYFKKVEQLTPDNYLAYLNLGATHLKMGHHAEAITVLQRAMSLNPENPRIYSNLGMAYYLERRYVEAAKWDEKAVALAPNSEVFWGNLAHARRWDAGLASRAPDAYRRAIDLGERDVISNPRNANLQARMAEYWAALGEKTKSLSAIARAEALARKSGYVQYRAALVYEESGNRKRALRALKSSMEFGYSLEEIQSAVPLNKLRDDPRYRELLAKRRSMAQNPCSLQQ